MVVIVSDWRNASILGLYGINLITSNFVALVGVVLQCLVWNFTYTNGNIFNVDFLQSML
jgi:hypothetical protein